MKHPVIIFCVVALLISFSLSITVTLDEPFKEVRVSKNNYVEVILEQNSSTGYSWYLQHNEDVNYVLEEEFEINQPQTGKFLRVGQNSKRVFKFKVVKSGQSFAIFEQKRIFDKEAEPMSVRMIGIIVE